MNYFLLFLLLHYIFIIFCLRLIINEGIDEQDDSLDEELDPDYDPMKTNYTKQIKSV